MALAVVSLWGIFSLMLGVWEEITPGEVVTKYVTVHEPIGKQHSFMASASVLVSRVLPWLFSIDCDLFGLGYISQISFPQVAVLVSLYHTQEA